MHNFRYAALVILMLTSSGWTFQNRAIGQDDPKPLKQLIEQYRKAKLEYNAATQIVKDAALNPDKYADEKGEQQVQQARDQLKGLDPQVQALAAEIKALNGTVPVVGDGIRKTPTKPGGVTNGVVGNQGVKLKKKVVIADPNRNLAFPIPGANTTEFERQLSQLRRDGVLSVSEERALVMRFDPLVVRYRRALDELRRHYLLEKTAASPWDANNSAAYGVIRGELQAKVLYLQQKLAFSLAIPTREQQDKLSQAQTLEEKFLGFLPVQKRKKLIDEIDALEKTLQQWEAMRPKEKGKIATQMSNYVYYEIMRRWARLSGIASEGSTALKKAQQLRKEVHEQWLAEGVQHLNKTRQPPIDFRMHSQITADTMRQFLGEHGWKIYQTENRKRRQFSPSR